jgi:DNA-binding NarL/FixJ family response regulator
VIKIAVVDDQELVRAGLRAVMAPAQDVMVVAEASDGRQAVALARERADLDVMLLDVRMPVLDGLAALTQIVDLRPELAVVMLTTFHDDEYVAKALQNGASGFLLKRASGHELVSAVRAAAEGGAVLAPQITREVIRRSTSLTGALDPGRAEVLAALTSRELDVLRMVTSGANNLELAVTLNLSESTVKTHVSRLMQKLECRDRVQLALLGVRLGVVDR